jgi:hypothetical protein
LACEGREDGAGISSLGEEAKVTGGSEGGVVGIVAGGGAFVRDADRLAGAARFAGWVEGAGAAGVLRVRVCFEAGIGRVLEVHWRRSPPQRVYGPGAG